MPLQKQVLDIPLSTGLDQKTDLRSIEMHGAVVMSNCVRLKNGSLRKRYGTKALSRTATNFGTITNGVAGGAHKNAMWMTDGANLYAYSDKTGVWQNQDKIPEAVALDRIQVAAFMGQVQDYDMAIGNGLLHVVMLAPAPTGTSFVLWDTLLDLSSFSSSTGSGGLQQGVTGAVVNPINFVDTSAAASLAPKLIVCGTTSVLTYIRGNGLYCRTFDLTTPGVTWSAETLLVATISTNAQTGVYDLSAIVGDATRFAVCVAVGTNTNVYACSVSSRTVTIGPKVAKAIDATSVGLYATNQSHYIAVISDNATNIFVGGYDEGTNALLTSALVSAADIPTPGKQAIIPSGLANNYTWIASSGGTVAGKVIYAQVSVVADVVANNSPVLKQIFNVKLASRPTYVASVGQAYFAVYVPSALQGTTYLMCSTLWSDTAVATEPFETYLYAARPVCTLAPRLQKNISSAMVAGGSYTLPRLLPLAIPDTSSSNCLLLPTVYSVQTFHNAIVAQPIDLSSPITYRSAELGDSTAITCGMPAYYDGQYLCEMGYLSYPEITVTMVGSGGALTAGSYQWCGTWEWYDARGQIHRSAPSPVVTKVAVNSDSATISSLAIQTMRARTTPGQPLNTLAYPPHVYFVLYRTAVNGTIFYRQTADPATSLNVVSNGLAPGLVDAMSDATLTASATAQILYTTGGILPNLNPPSARCIVQHGQRIFLGGCDNPRQVWASKALTDGEAPGFHEQLAFDATGAVRALQSMDGNLIIFVQRGTSYGIEYVAGQGPTDAGTQSDWTPPIPIPSDVGAVDQRGTCAGPFGILFHSPVGGPRGAGGFFLLSRDLQVKYVGAAVEDALAQEGFVNACSIVTSMVLHPTAGLVYITTIVNDQITFSANQTRIVWDYIQGVWSTDILWDTDFAITGLSARHAWIAMAGGVAGAVQAPTYHCLSNVGRVYRETNGVGAGAYLDAGSTWITSRYRGPLWKPTMGGFARFWRAQFQGDSKEACDLTVTLTFDGAPSSYYSEVTTWTAAQIAAFDRAPQIDFELCINNQKARSIQFEISDATPTGGGVVTGQGSQWAAVSLELGVKPGLYRNLPDGQRA